LEEIGKKTKVFWATMSYPGNSFERILHKLKGILAALPNGVGEKAKTQWIHYVRSSGSFQFFSLLTEKFYQILPGYSPRK
jgi:hypothetical protein